MTELMGDAVTHLTTDPVEQAADSGEQALLQRVRAGRSKDFDRLVSDFDGPVPGVAGPESRAAMRRVLGL